ncbi:MAG TPA: biotin carboxylase N-terminal domain-containing protein [Candidatus Limnocylindrales bacterium]
MERGRAIRTLFVANRGEIARRIAVSARRLSIEPVLAHAPTAPGAPGASVPAPLDLLDPEAVVAAAVTAGADALHPGYGFLAESPVLAAAVEAAGLRWVGPPAAAIAAMGDKGAARRLAASLGVPVAPGYDGPDQDDAALLGAAERLGLPLLVKPAAGGGGKGMRTVRDRTALPEAIAAARREARASFGDDRLVLERLLEGPRHVEVQVLFDAEGRGVQLGERDCSVQRRHQKILEETPSPAVTPATRARLGDAALRLAAAVGYVSAGTVEFLLADDGSIAFLEMNTRLQVEHPVTELVTGRDLVADQLRIATGATLAELGLDDGPDTDEPTSPTRFGHAVEVRLYAEDADAGFLPATGRLELVRWSSDAVPFGDARAVRTHGLRLDAGAAVGDDVTGRYDPLLAKLIAAGRDRTQALERLRRGLDETVVLGLTTNLAFLRWLVRQPWLLDGEARVDTLEAAWAAASGAGGGGGAERSTGEIPERAWATAAWRLSQAIDEDVADPFAGGWRLNAPAALALASGGRHRRVPVPSSPPEAAPASALAADGTLHLDVDGRSVAVRLDPPPDVQEALRAAAHQGGAADLAAPMPGSVIAIHVATGDAVEAGDPVVTLEAMKMEHVVAASGPGSVEEVLVAVGQQVVRGQPLAVLGARP